jgi:hypothetical protein
MRIERLIYQAPLPEENREGGFDIIVSEEVEAFGRKTRHVEGPHTPEVIEKRYGLSLAQVVGHVTAQMADERDKAMRKSVELEDVAAGAKAAAAIAAAQRDEAVQNMALAAQAALDARVAQSKAEQNARTLGAELERLSQPAAKEGPANPILNALTFGLAGR